MYVERERGGGGVYTCFVTANNIFLITLLDVKILDKYL